MDSTGTEKTFQKTTLGKTSLPIQRWALYVAAVVAAFVLISSLWIGYRRIAWYDEILVLTIARLQGSGAVFKAISGSASSLPPFYFLVVRFFDQLLGPHDGAARIPSALAVTAGLAIIFDCARRFTDNVHALAAIGLLTCSFLPYYGYEARPYALCFLLSAIALWLWSHSESDRKVVALLFGLSFFFSFCLHYYSALALIPYAALEASEWRPFRRPTLKLIAGGVGVVAGVLVCAPFMMAARKFSRGFWSPASVPAIRDVFHDLFPVVAIVGAIVVGVLVLRPRRDAIVVPPMLQIERLGWLFLWVPVIGLVMAVAVTNAFVSRYFIVVLPGIAVAFACALWRRFRPKPAVTAAIAAALLIAGTGQQLRWATKPASVRPPTNPDDPVTLRKMLDFESTLLSHGRTTIVVRSDDLLALEAPYYSRHAGAYALLMLGESAIVTRAHVGMSRFKKMTFWSMDDLIAHADSAALVNPSDVALDALTKAGFRLQFVDSGSGLLKVFYVSRT